MTVEAAAMYLTRALIARARSWVPCETSPGELEREYGGPPATLTGRVMRDPLFKDAVLNNVERHGWTVRYDRRRRSFLMSRAGGASARVDEVSGGPRRFDGSLGVSKRPAW